MNIAYNPAKLAPPPARILPEPVAAQPFPLSVTCVGEVERVDEHFGMGPWWVQQSLVLGKRAGLVKAIEFAREIVANREYPLGDADGSDFAAELFLILDRDRRLVLAGNLVASAIVWCPPVVSDAEARQVVQQASRLRAKATYEAGCDNHRAARRLRRDASVLEGRLVDIRWRDAVRRALQEIG